MCQSLLISYVQAEIISYSQREQLIFKFKFMVLIYHTEDILRLMFLH